MELEAAIHIAAAANGGWKVTESGPPTAVSCFGEWRDAVGYALRAARRLQLKQVQVTRGEDVIGSVRSVRSKPPLR